jgi:cytochrome b involved in lipid metabolism
MPMNSKLVKFSLLGMNQVRRKPQVDVEFTWKEIRATQPKKLSTKAISEQKEALIVIKNKVYNIAGEFESWHPGGSVALTQVDLID